MRLTEKINGEYGLICPNVNWGNNIPDVREHARKLGQLEDIEDELGLPLTTYFKLVYANYVYCYGYGNAIMKCNITNIDIRNKSISCWNGVTSMRKTFNEYGTWWALTKEEIEHGN